MKICVLKIKTVHILEWRERESLVKPKWSLKEEKGKWKKEKSKRSVDSLFPLEKKVPISFSSLLVLMTQISMCKFVTCHFHPSLPLTFLNFITNYIILFYPQSFCNPFIQFSNLNIKLYWLYKFKIQFLSYVDKFWNTLIHLWPSASPRWCVYYYKFENKGIYRMTKISLKTQLWS